MFKINITGIEMSSFYACHFNQIIVYVLIGYGKEHSLKKSGFLKRLQKYK